MRTVDTPISIQKVLCICSIFSHCESYHFLLESRKSFVFFGLAKILFPTFKQPEWNHAGSINFLLTCAREKIRILSSYILYYACILNREGTIRSEEGERASPPLCSTLIVSHALIQLSNISDQILPKMIHLHMIWWLKSIGVTF